MDIALTYKSDHTIPMRGARTMWPLPSIAITIHVFLCVFASLRLCVKKRLQKEKKITRRRSRHLLPQFFT